MTLNCTDLSNIEKVKFIISKSINIQSINLNVKYSMFNDITYISDINYNIPITLSFSIPESIRQIKNQIQ